MNDKIKEYGKDTQFSTSRQPSGESKSAGAKKAWEYKRLRQCFVEELLSMEMPDGSVSNFWELCTKEIYDAIFSPDSTLREMEKLNIILRLLSILSKDDDNVGFQLSEHPKIVYEIVDKGGNN